METVPILALIDEELRRLQQARPLLAVRAKRSLGRPSASFAALKKHKLSAARLGESKAAKRKVNKAFDCELPT
jgi:hypothetical protein